MIPDGIANWIRRRAISSEARPAIEYRGTVIGYAALADRIDALAAGLARIGVRPGDRVAFLGDNHPAFVECLFGVGGAGGVFVPLNTRLSVPELAFILRDCGARTLISTEPMAALAAAAAPGLTRITVSGDAGAHTDPDALDYDRVLAEAVPQASPPARTADDDAVIVYTSGTTGRPKGAVLTHGNLTWNAMNVLADYDVLSTERWLMISPLFHVAALGMGCLPVLLKGATLLLEERFDAGDALRSIEFLHATAISGVPTTYQLMIEDPAWAATDLSSLRLLTCGGSAVPARVREAFESRGLAFSSGYGMTEAAPGVTMLPPTFSKSKAGSSGLAHFFSAVRVRGDDGQVHDRGTGEVEVRGPNVFSRYWNLPDATRDALTADGWLRTGDVGELDEQGFLTISDRLKDMIISGGENVYSAEVEQALLTIDGVTGAAVVGVPHERWGEVPHAFVTLAEGATLDPGEMVALLTGRLARYKIPRSLEVVVALPRTASGKVQKHLLRHRSLAVADDS